MSLPISFLIPIWNPPDPKWLADCINSCLVEDIEKIILVSDGCTNGTVSQLEQYAYINSRLKVILLKEHRGISTALNVGINACSSEYIARMDADDIHILGSLQPRLLMLEQGFSLCGGSVRLFDNKGPGGVIKSWMGWEQNEGWKETIQQRKTICFHPTWLVNTKVLLRHPYNPKAEPAEDLDVLTRILMDGKRVCNVSIPCTWHRSHERQESKTRREEQNDKRTTIIESVCRNSKPTTFI
jgi:glycosyltransferase involved in cell wall biosynthesis